MGKSQRLNDKLLTNNGCTCFLCGWLADLQTMSGPEVMITLRLNGNAVHVAAAWCGDPSIVWTQDAIHPRKAKSPDYTG